MNNHVKNWKFFSLNFLPLVSYKIRHKKLPINPSFQVNPTYGMQPGPPGLAHGGDPGLLHIRIAREKLDRVHDSSSWVKVKFRF